MVKVKICGITNEEDARLAIQCGADYVGFIFAPSKRSIIKETAMRIMQATDPFRSYVGVFLNGKKKEIEETCAYTGISILQFHGEETPAFCNYFLNRGYQVIKVIRVSNGASLDAVRAYEKVQYFLLDTYTPAAYGGTGEPFDWSLLARLEAFRDKYFFISGGLDDRNVATLFSVFKPYGVDASSKLEKEAGIKDPARMKAFISAVRKGDAHGTR